MCSKFIRDSGVVAMRSKNVISPLFITLIIAMLAIPAVRAQFVPGAPSSSAMSIPDSQLIQPEALVGMLKSSEKEKPLIFQVGSRVMYAQAHIPGSEYAGPGSQAS